MHQFLTQLAVHRRPSPSASASGEVTLRLADYTTLNAAVAIRVAPMSGLLREAESGETAVANFSGFCDHRVDVRERDVFTVSGVHYRVTFMGAVGYLRTFDLARVVIQ